MITWIIKKNFIHLQKPKYDLIMFTLFFLEWIQFGYFMLQSLVFHYSEIALRYSQYFQTRSEDQIYMHSTTFNNRYSSSCKTVATEVYPVLIPDENYEHVEFYFKDEKQVKEETITCRYKSNMFNCLLIEIA